MPSLTFNGAQGDGSNSNGDIGDNPDKNFYLAIYGGSALAFLVLAVVKGAVFTDRMLAASSGLHRKLVAQILRAPMAFFDVTQSGETTSRFSRDVDEVGSRPTLSSFDPFSDESHSYEYLGSS